MHKTVHTNLSLTLTDSLMISLAQTLAHLSEIKVFAAGEFKVVLTSKIPFQVFLVSLRASTRSNWLELF